MFTLCTVNRPLTINIHYVYIVHTMNKTLKEIREEAGFTQDEVANALGMCGRQAVSAWERGISRPYAHTVILSSLYKVGIEQLMRSIQYTHELNNIDPQADCAKTEVQNG